MAIKILLLILAVGLYLPSPTFAQNGNNPGCFPLLFNFCSLISQFQPICQVCSPNPSPPSPPAQVSITSPKDGSFVVGANSTITLQSSIPGDFTFVLRASPNGSNNWADVYTIDHVATPHTFTWNSKQVSNGLKYLGIGFYDWSSNTSGISNIVPITVNNVAAPSDVIFEEDVIYGTGGSQNLLLNIVRPKNPSSSSLPTVILIHGGGWMQGDQGMLNWHAWELARRGYVVATIQYRFTPIHSFPAQVEDAKCAVRFLRANASRYGLDSQRIGAMGWSSGGYLALMLGVLGPNDGFEGNGGSASQSSRVNAVVSFAGPTDLSQAFPTAPVNIQALINDFLKGISLGQASPITYASAGDAPMLLFHGEADPVVPFAQGSRMIQAATNAGVPARLETIPNGDHGANWNWLNTSLPNPVWPSALSFLDQQLQSSRLPPPTPIPANIPPQTPLPTPRITPIPITTPNPTSTRPNPTINPKTIDM